MAAIAFADRARDALARCLARRTGALDVLMAERKARWALTEADASAAKAAAAADAPHADPPKRKMLFSAAAFCVLFPQAGHLPPSRGRRRPRRLATPRARMMRLLACA
jgi:hypothetical protein